MTKTIRANFTAHEVMIILTRHLVAAKDIHVGENTKFSGELMAAVEADTDGSPCIRQYRLEVNLDQVPGDHSWN